MGVPILDGVGDFPSLIALTSETEEAANDTRLVMTDFLRRPRNLTSAPENRRRLHSSLMDNRFGKMFSKPHQQEYTQGRSSPGRIFGEG